jgi:hypothetical protein
MTDLVIPQRFCGPASSGNGGWTSGALAGLVERGSPDNRADAWPAIRVALRKPPPLDTPLVVTEEDGVTRASVDGGVVVQAQIADAEPAPVEPVPADEAGAAMAAYPGLTSHPFPTCFACGTGREEGDGLRIFPGPVGPVDGATRIASTWTPHPSVAEDWHAYVDDVRHASLAVTWAALDCVGGWAGDLTDRLMVLAGMTARVDTLPVVGEEHVVVGAARGRDGRKTFTAATLYDPDGRIVAVAEHVWVAVDPANFR